MNTIRALGLGTLDAEADKKGFLELGNPAASGRTGKVTVIRVNSADTDVNIITHTVTDAGSGDAATVKNKVIGGTAPTLAVKVEALATIAGTTVSTVKQTANTDINFYFIDAPIVLPPGTYLKVANNAVNKDLNYVAIEWHEIRDINR